MTKYRLMLELLESRYGDDYDDDNDGYDPGDDYEKFNEDEDVSDTFTVQVNKANVVLAYTGTQRVAVNSEPETRDSPGWSEVAEYGEITLETVALKINGREIGELGSLSGLATSDIYAKHNDCIEDIMEVVYEATRRKASIDFCTKLLTAFVAHLKGKEGPA